MIKRLENSTIHDSRFHGHYFETTKEDLEKVCGKVMYYDNDINEKTQNEWEMVTEDGTPFTIYDYKEYRDYEDYEKIEWHIGTENRFGSKKAYEAIKRAFHLHPKITYNI
jgi:hypothetical protein|tara:strand:+ start:214 stop:543 length:330 start_codon:yes stop_codon:yes gene_type:complete